MKLDAVPRRAACGGKGSGGPDRRARGQVAGPAAGRARLYALTGCRRFPYVRKEEWGL